MDDLFHGLASMGQDIHMHARAEGAATALQGAAFGATFDALSSGASLDHTLGSGPDRDTLITVAGNEAELQAGTDDPLTSPADEVAPDNGAISLRPPPDEPVTQTPAPPSSTNVAINAQFAEQFPAAPGSAPVRPQPATSPTSPVVNHDQPPNVTFPPLTDAWEPRSQGGGAIVGTVGASPAPVAIPKGFDEGPKGLPPSQDPDGRQPSPSGTGWGRSDNRALLPQTSPTTPASERDKAHLPPPTGPVAPRQRVSAPPGTSTSTVSAAVGQIGARAPSDPHSTLRGHRDPPGIGVSSLSGEQARAKVQPLAVNAAAPARALSLPTAPASDRADMGLRAQTSSLPILVDRAAATATVPPPLAAQAVKPQDVATGEQGGATATRQPRAKQTVGPGPAAGAPTILAPPHPLAKLPSHTGPAAPVPIQPTPQTAGMAAAPDATPSIGPTTGPLPANASQRDIPLRSAQPLRTGGWTMAPTTPAASFLPAPRSFPLHPLTSEGTTMSNLVVAPLLDLDFALHAPHPALSTTALTSSAVAAHHPPSPTAQGIAQQISAALSNPAPDTDAPIELALDPPELGRLRLQLTEVAGAMTLMIHAERPETADLMRRHLQLLAQEFTQAGLEAPTVHIRQEGHGAGANPDGDTSRHGSADRQTAALSEPETQGNRPLSLHAAAGGLDLRL